VIDTFGIEIIDASSDVTPPANVVQTVAPIDIAPRGPGQPSVVPFAATLRRIA